MSTSAAEHLSPAFPERAAWGTAGKLRAWQAAALEKYLAEGPQDFLAVATPGAGKTTFALRIAVELLEDRTVDTVTVVARACFTTVLSASRITASTFSANGR